MILVSVAHEVADGVAIHNPPHAGEQPVGKLLLPGKGLLFHLPVFGFGLHVAQNQPRNAQHRQRGDERRQRDGVGLHLPRARLDDGGAHHADDGPVLHPGGLIDDVVFFPGQPPDEAAALPLGDIRAHLGLFAPAHGQRAVHKVEHVVMEPVKLGLRFQREHHRAVAFHHIAVARPVVERDGNRLFQLVVSIGDGQPGVCRALHQHGRVNRLGKDDLARPVRGSIRRENRLILAVYIQKRAFPVRRNAVLPADAAVFAVLVEHVQRAVLPARRLVPDDRPRLLRREVVELVGQIGVPLVQQLPVSLREQGERARHLRIARLQMGDVFLTHQAPVDVAVPRDFNKNQDERAEDGQI